MMLYAISITDMEKFKAIADQFKEMYADKNIEVVDNVTPSDNYPIDTTPEVDELPDITEYEMDPDSDVDSHIENGEVKSDTFNLLYEKIKLVLFEKGYDEFVTVDKIEEYIYFRFKDGILFYPDLPEMKTDSFDILSSVGEIIKEAGDLVSSIDISGYTAKVSEADDKTLNFFSWELSVNRSLTVLKYLINQCDLPQSKMSIAGFAHFQPFADDSTSEGRALNRRVEIRITRNASDDNDAVIDDANDIAKDEATDQNTDDVTKQNPLHVTDEIPNAEIKQ
ncbi:MAG: Flagellar motor protein [Clostridia bacterium]|nr:Flagellar motor protein [Clostridia bacterium]